MKKCPYCDEEIKDEAKICRFCGKELESKQEINSPKKVGVAGIIAITTAGIALFMPVILMTFLAPIAFVTASVELSRGKKWVGTIAMILSIIELAVVLSTFQSCARNLSSIGTGTYRSDKAVLNWKKNLKLVYHSVDSPSYSDYEIWTIEVENVGTKTIKEAKFNLTLKDLDGNVVFTKSYQFLYSWDTPMAPGEIRKFTMYVDKIRSKKTSDTFSYSFDILDYED